MKEKNEYILFFKIVLVQNSHARGKELNKCCPLLLCALHITLSGFEQLDSPTSYRPPHILRRRKTIFTGNFFLRFTSYLYCLSLSHSLLVNLSYLFLQTIFYLIPLLFSVHLYKCSLILRLCYFKLFVYFEALFPNLSSCIVLRIVYVNAF